MYACRGLTDDSGDIPLSQFGALRLEDFGVLVSSFDGFLEAEAIGEILVATSESDDGNALRIDRKQDTLALTLEEETALKTIDDFQNQIFYIDDDDVGNYRLHRAFFKKHKKVLEADSQWIETGFCGEVYVASEIVRSTGNGWSF